jgi:hypothetical protein
MMSAVSFIAALLKQASTLDDLHRAKAHSDNQEYRPKADILKRLMRVAPADWKVDQPDRKFPGVTHIPSGYRFHLPAYAVSLRKAAGLPIAQLKGLLSPTTAQKAIGALSGVAGKANSALRSSVGAVPGQTTAAATLRHAAGVTPGATFGQNPVANTRKLLLQPKYPGLDKPIGSVAPRPLDRTRSALGTSLRVGSGVAGAGSAAAATNFALNDVPRGIARGVSDGMEEYQGLPTDRAGYEANPGPSNDFIARHNQRIPLVRSAAPGVLFSSLFGSNDPASRIAGNIAAETAIPSLRHTVWNSRQQAPLLMGSVDALRSATPFGAAATLGLRAFGSRTPVDAAAASRRHIQAELQRSGTPETLLSLREHPQLGKIITQDDLRSYAVRKAQQQIKQLPQLQMPKILTSWPSLRKRKPPA